MNLRPALKAIAATAFLLSLHGGALAQNDLKAAIQPLPFVSPLFGDNMVLQRGKANTIWGWSDPGDKVRVEIAGKYASGVAEADGHWQVEIQPPPSGGPYTLTIKGHQTVELQNVLVGDVWLCGGQSNMQVGLRFVRNGEEEIKAADYPEIRFFTVAAHPAYHHTDVPKGNWAAPDLDDSTWKFVEVPGGFSELGVPDTPAVVWFRKDIVLPDPLPVGRASLFLGSVERMDTAYINGTEVGASAWVENPRVYLIRDGVLQPGKNVLAIRVFKTKPQGGFLAKSDELRLTLGDKTSIPLAGKWKVQLSVDARPPRPMPIGFENWPVMPSVLYEGMLAPVAPLSITGALWYQGEQNSDRGFQYRRL